eukprot:gnl/Spiro4/1214_TR639_c0_g1_i1.p1 gnl/Spiro4/1214_TR639_c0_g1~~gnl/Spiro4/1214_TR639_c0_g1_i1.p1  ORF type:complete len:391 (+),score=76.52 gnl/Spiro4/1214_TR639_c0_g1_i1:72-1175(+)
MWFSPSTTSRGFLTSPTLTSVVSDATKARSKIFALAANPLTAATLLPARRDEVIRSDLPVEGCEGGLPQFVYAGFRNERVSKTLLLDPEVFGVPLRPDIVHQHVRWQLARRRSGTAMTKTRSMVRGSTKKLHQQKGTGRARVGGMNSPIRRGGGRAFGKVPRSFDFKINAKVKKLAVRMVLSAKYQANKLIVVQNIDVPAPRTKLFNTYMLQKHITSALIATGEVVPRNLDLASRNLQNVFVCPYDKLNVYEVLYHDILVLNVEAVEKLTERLRPSLPRYFKTAPHPALPSQPLARDAARAALRIARHEQIQKYIRRKKQQKQRRQSKKNYVRREWEREVLRRRRPEAVAETSSSSSPSSVPQLTSS